MISSNIDDVAASLALYIKETERKMRNMVAGFAKEVASSASERTPIASEWMIKNDESYRNWYQDRFDRHGIAQEAGYHKGAWQYSESQDLTFNPNINSFNTMSSQVTQDAKARYRIGDSFYIGAVGPAYETLEAGYDAGGSTQARNGIVKPTLALIMAAHSADLKSYFDAG